jgi:3-deoxy-D-arabino-heptulosonate 7-phosphate (DAHP) synthase class II
MLYERAKEQVDRIHDLYDALTDELESYKGWIDELLEAERAKEAPDPKFLSAIGVQARFTSNLLRLLEEDGFDEFVHFADRVIRIKHWEEGTFI